MRLSEEKSAVLSALSAAFPAAWQVPMSGADAVVEPAHPLFAEIEALANDRVCTFPFIRGAIANWVTFGGTNAALRDSIDTLRAWLMPAHASEEANPIVSPANASGVLAAKILSVSHHGYFRWRSPSSNVERIAKKLAQIRFLERRRPNRPIRRNPSLLELRTEFQIAYTMADWAAAERAIAQIDALQLDSALNTAQMRIRLWAGLAEYERVVQYAESTGVLYLNITDRIRQLVLEAYACIELSPLEESGTFGEAAERYRERLHAKLAGAITALRETPTARLQRLVAYRAWADEDCDALFDRRLPATDELVKFLKGTRPEAVQAPPPTLTSAPEQPPPTRWTDLVTLTLVDRDDLVDDFLDRHCTLGELRRPGQAEACSESLLQLYTDTKVSSHASAKRSRSRVLMRVIETALCDAGFPMSELESLYTDILELWVMEHGDSSFPAYGQLVLSVSEGLLALSARHEELVLRCVRDWWSRRPTHARLGWLLEAIDLLSLQASATHGIDALWIAGMALIQRDRTTTPPGERRLWRQLASRLAVSDATVEAYLAGVIEECAAEDALATAHLKRIAIVTLQERAGRMAADILAERTQAEILLVSSTVADASTRAATDADLILFVWAASKHAVLRAFDGVRQKLEYVQGTGPGSIVLAAERWVAAHGAG
jgi:hypothetical protein